MFRKLVSNLAFSPALVGQLGFYAKRLRKEESIRRVGLIFTVFALVVQSFAVFQAPEPATAADATDMVYGGVWSKQALLSTYDSNVNNIRDLYEAAGISRSDIDQAGNNLEYHSSREGMYSWGLKPVFGPGQGEGGYTVKTGGGSRTFYYRPQRLWAIQDHIQPMSADPQRQVCGSELCVIVVILSHSLYHPHLLARPDNPGLTQIAIRQCAMYPAKLIFQQMTLDARQTQ